MLSINAIKALISVVVITAGITFAYSWHTSKVQEVVSSATNKIKLDLATQSLKALEQRDRANQELQEKVQSIELQAQKQMRDSTAKYNRVLADFNYFSRLSERSKSTGTTGSNASTNPANTTDAEATTGDNFGRLYRKDAINLIDYARDTERLRINLLACYQQYDDVQEQLKNLNQLSKVQ